MGHIKKNCYKFKREKGKGKNEKKDEDGDRVSAADSTGDLVHVSEIDLVNTMSDDHSWVIDSAATLHMTPRKELFTSFKSGNFGKLRIGNDAVSEVAGIGDVCLKTQMGTTLLLKDVRYAPDVRLNLISVHRLDDEGYENYFGDGRWKLKRGNMIVARGIKESKFYRLESVPSTDVNVAENLEASHLWHRRLSHISEKGLNLLAKKDVLPGLKKGELEKCSHCLAGKQNKVSFKKHSSSRRAELLELVHSGVCGPLKVRSSGGAYYFVTFIEDHSRKLWVYALKTKDQVLEKFREFHVMVER